MYICYTVTPEMITAECTNLPAGFEHCVNENNHRSLFKGHIQKGWMIFSPVTLRFGILFLVYNDLKWFFIASMRTLFLITFYVLYLFWFYNLNSFFKGFIGKTSLVFFLLTLNISSVRQHILLSPPFNFLKSWVYSR